MKKILYVLFIVLLSSLVSAALSDGVVTDHSFNNVYSNGTHSIDTTGQHNFTNTSMLSNVAGILNQASDYDGAGSRYVSGTDAALELEETAFTINFWINPDNWSTVPYIIHRGDATTYFSLYSPSTGKVGLYDSAGSCRVYPGTVVPTGAWTMVTWVWNTTHAQIYFNASLSNTSACTLVDTAGDTLVIGSYVTGSSNALNGQLDQLTIWNTTLNSSEITTLFNSGSGREYPFTGAAANFSVTATDENTGAILNISLWVDGDFFGTNTTVTTNITATDTDLHTVVVGSTDYFNRTYASYNVSVSGNLAAQLHQAEVCFNASEKVSEAWLTPDNFTINGTTRASCFNLSSGSANVQALKAGWFSKNQTFTITALQNNTQTVVNMSYANLTISAIDGSTNESLTNYSLTISSINYTGWPGETAASVTNYSFYLINGTYNVTIDVPGYELTGGIANVSVSGNTNYTFTLYKSNSIRITIRDEITNDLILSNITARFTNNATTWENVTDTGGLFVYNLTPDVYTILFYGSGYSTRTYVVTVGNRTSQELTAYMLSSNYSTIFTIKDADSADVIDNVSISMYKLINSTWTVVESKYSDISGRAMFYYDPIGSYKFYLSRENYTDYVFFLNPILFSSYDVYMSKTSLLNASQDFDGLALIYAPSSFPNNVNTTFNFIFSSPDGLLTEYGINLTYPGGSVNLSGYNAIGSQLSVSVNITNATAYDTVRLDYYYITSTIGRRNFTAYLPIEFNVSASDLTFLSNKNKTYGLGIFERILIITIIVLFIVGIATLVGQPIPGLALGLFSFGYMSYIGFVPLWAILPSMFIGLLFLVWKSGGY